MRAALRQIAVVAVYLVLIIMEALARHVHLVVDTVELRVALRDLLAVFVVIRRLARLDKCAEELDDVLFGIVGEDGEVLDRFAGDKVGTAAGVAEVDNAVIVDTHRIPARVAGEARGEHLVEGYYAEVGRAVIRSDVFALFRITESGLVRLGIDRYFGVVAAGGFYDVAAQIGDLDGRAFGRAVCLDYEDYHVLEL